jgi:hypothetical protein
MTSALELSHTAPKEGNIMPEFTVGNYLATRLEQIGLEHYFVVPGDFNLVLLDQLLENKNMEQIGCTNELNASYAAEGYARVNGCGAVVTTMNVGAFSALNGVAGAYAARLPVIFVSSGYNTNDESANHFVHHSIGTRDFSYQQEMFRYVTCAAVRVMHPDDAPSMIDHAIRKHGRLCPVPDYPRSCTAVRGAGGAGGRRWPATSAIGAALIDLQPEGSGLAPVFTNAGSLWGLAVGGLGASALVQYAPAPTHLIWWLLLGTTFAAALAILTLPETSAGHPNVLASLRPSVGIPRQARTTFARTAPIFGAAWALNGFYLSLGPSLAGEVFRSRNLLWGGLVIFLLTAVAGTATVVARARSTHATMMIGCIALFAGAAITFAAVAMTSAGAFLAGIAIAGIGVGLAFLGSFRVLSALATPGQRASLISAIFIATYTAFSLPVVIAGIATSRFGLHGTGPAYCAALAALAALGLVSLLLQGRADTGTAAPILTMDKPLTTHPNASSKCLPSVRTEMK